MLNLLVETKNEYTTHLINILTPLIFEGLQSIYKEAQDIAGTDNVLKIFQSFLKRIPKWNQSIIEKETERIINSSHSYGWLNDLIKATLKANLIVLIFNPTIKTQNRIDNSFYQNININDFIHKVYIECARDIWNNPYLLYHNYPPIEIKRNQRDCINIIKDCIRESIRKLLPVKHILQIYLGEEMELNKLDDNFEKAMTDAEEKNLSKLIKKDLENDNNLELKFNNNLIQQTINSPIQQTINSPIQQTINSPIQQTINSPIQQTIKSPIQQTINSPIQQTINSPIQQTINSPIQQTINSPIQNNYETQNTHIITHDYTSQTTSDNKTIGSRILNIINKNSVTSSNSDSISEVKQSIKKMEEHIIKQNESIDEKIKNILQKDLASDTDLETSLNYSHEDNDKNYQEIFTNDKNLISAKPDANTKDKKYFDSYLQF
jgi:hypothetical protein